MHEPEAAAPASPRSQWLDLAACAAIAVLGLILVSAPVALRLPVGLAAVLLVPGYALTTVVFPTDEHLDAVERIAIGLGLSFALVSVEALALHLTNTLTEPAMRLTTTGASIVFLVAGAVRRARLRREVVDQSASQSPDRTTSRAARFTRAVVVVNLVIAALAYSLTVLDVPPHPIEFYVLGPDGKIAEYPLEAKQGERVSVELGLRQSTAGTDSYDVLLRRGSTTLADLGPLRLAASEEWRRSIDLPTTTIGPDQEITFELRRAGEERALRTLRLWLDVEPRQSP